MKLIKIPFSAGGLGKSIGCELAPDKIIGAMNEQFLNEDGILPVFDIDDVAVGNLEIEQAHEKIFTAVKKGIEERDKCFILGGDHSITYSAFKAFSEKFENPGLLVFDAHPNCANKISPPTNEDYLRTLVEERAVRKENIILVGVRKWNKDEHRFLRESKIKAYDMKEISIENNHEVSESLMEVSRGFGALYISIDISVIDPAFAPGSTYTEPGGMSSRDILFFLNRLKRLQNLKAIDLVEVNPNKDLNDMTVKLGAKILSEIC